MNLCGHKTRRRWLLLLTGVYLAAPGLYAQDSSTAKSPPQPAAHSTPASNHAATTPAVAKKAATPAATPHTATNSKPVAHSASAQSAAPKATAHASSVQAAKRTPAQTTAHASSAKVASKTPARATAHTPQRASSSARYRRARPLTGAERLARLRLQPERIQEIQQALIREGYLRGDANGQWDAATHDAMLRFQTDHGFPTTGLPEAKSLMKLGLGSHPLPPELDHGPVAGAGGVGAAGDLTVAAPLPPVSQATPPSPDPSSPPHN